MLAINGNNEFNKLATYRSLMEVVGPNAAEVATRLSTATGGSYSVVIAPGESVYSKAGENENEQVIRDTAIVVNL